MISHVPGALPDADIHRCTNAIAVQQPVVTKRQGRSIAWNKAESLAVCRAAVSADRDATEGTGIYERRTYRPRVALRVYDSFGLRPPAYIIAYEKSQIRLYINI